MIKNELEDIKIKNEQEFFGIYRGVVEDDNPKENNVELQDGRIRVRVWGLHSKYKKNDPIDNINVIPTDELPLAQPAYPVIIGSITGKGCWSVPCQGTHVFVFFENGDPMQPRYFATAPGIQPDSMTFDSNIGFTDPDKDYPLSALMNQPDMNKLMRENGHPTGTAWENIINKENVDPCLEIWKFEPGDHISNYPNNYVIETRGKQTLELNHKKSLLYQNDDSYLLLKDDGETLLMGDFKTHGRITTINGLTSHNGIESHGITSNILVNTLQGVNIGSCNGPWLPLAFFQFVLDMIYKFDTHTHCGEIVKPCNGFSSQEEGGSGLNPWVSPDGRTGLIIPTLEEVAAWEAYLSGSRDVADGDDYDPEDMENVTSLFEQNMAILYSTEYLMAD